MHLIAVNCAAFITYNLHIINLCIFKVCLSNFLNQVF